MWERVIFSLCFRKAASADAPSKIHDNVISLGARSDVVPQENSFGSRLAEPDAFITCIPPKRHQEDSYREYLRLFFYLLIHTSFIWLMSVWQKQRFASSGDDEERSREWTSDSSRALTAMSRAIHIVFADRHFSCYFSVCGQKFDQT